MEKEKKQRPSFLEVQRSFAPSKDVKAFNYNYSNLNTLLNELIRIGAEYTLELQDTEFIKAETVRSDAFKEDKYKKTLIPYVKTEHQIILRTFWKFKFNDDEPVIKSFVSSGTQTDLDKAVGSAYSYARRYILLNIFNANDGGEFDPENKDKEELITAKQEALPAAKPATPKQIATAAPAPKPKPVAKVETVMEIKDKNVEDPAFLFVKEELLALAAKYNKDFLKNADKINNLAVAEKYLNMFKEKYLPKAAEEVEEDDDFESLFE